MPSQDPGDHQCEAFVVQGLAFKGREFVRDLPLRALAVAPDAFFTLPDPDRVEEEDDEEQDQVRRIRQISEGQWVATGRTRDAPILTVIGPPLACRRQHPHPGLVEGDGPPSLLTPLLEALEGDPHFRAIMQQAAG